MILMEEIYLVKHLAVYHEEPPDIYWLFLTYQYTVTLHLVLEVFGHIIIVPCCHALQNLVYINEFIKDK